MLVELFPRMHRRYSCLRLLGPILDSFAGWLHARGYPRVAVRRHLRAARRLEQRWLRRGVRSLSAIRPTDFQICAPGHSQDDPDLAAVARSLKTYFEECGLLAGEPAPETPSELTGYQQYLTALRGLALGTIADHLATVSQFLQFIADQRPAMSLGQLTSRELEAFVQQVAARVSRATLQHVIAHVRSFLGRRSNGTAARTVRHHPFGTLRGAWGSSVKTLTNRSRAAGFILNIHNAST